MKDDLKRLVEQTNRNIREKVMGSPADSPEGAGEGGGAGEGISDTIPPELISKIKSSPEFKQALSMGRSPQQAYQIAKKVFNKFGKIDDWYDNNKPESQQ